MKKLFLLITLLTVITTQAQGTIDFSIYQDVKLAIMEDDHGNTPFTPDVRLDFTFNGGDADSKVWGFLGGTVQYADLHGGSFFRWGLQGGMGIKSGIQIDRLKIDWDSKIEPYIGLAKIDRGVGNTLGNISFEMGVNWALVLSDSFDIVAKTNIMQRGDLEFFGDDSASFRPWDWQPQFSVGLRYKL